MIHGVASDQEQLLWKIVVTPLKMSGCRVWLFGSRARGDHKKFSDIDLLYEVPQEQPFPHRLISDIQEAAEESSLFYKIDLVNINELASSYRDNVLKERVELNY